MKNHELNPSALIRPICILCSTAVEHDNPECYRCPGCGQRYPIRFGIADFRHPDLIKADPLAERMCALLIAAYPQGTHAQLTQLYFQALRISLNDFPEDLLANYTAYHEQAMTRGKQFAAMFVERNEQVFGRISRTVALDIGCGSAASLAWLATQFEQVVGIDPSLPSLILARKLLEENGVENATLIRGFGQHIPFDANTFNFVSAQNVLEHVFTIDEVVAEVARVLMEKGGFSADSRNRFDLLFKEPHVKLRWVGFLPRDLARRYVEWRTGQPYDHTKLQSYWNSKHALRQAFGSQIKIAFPDVTIYGFPAKMGKPLSTLEQIDWIAQPILTLFPSHLLLARKL